MRIDVITIFPGMFDSPFAESIIKRAREQGHLELGVHDLRDFCEDRHKVVDDYPYGGGAGMVMRPEPALRALAALKGPETLTLLPAPTGEPLRQTRVEELRCQEHLLIFCPHYEGLDERVVMEFDCQFSLGDYILTGGELPAMVLIDAVVRLLPGVLGSAASLEEESFSPLLEYPHYTRPAEYRGRVVPEVLLSGHHARIREWRRRQALRRTFERRPDLLSEAELSPAEQELLAEWRRSKNQNSEKQSNI